MKAESPYLIAGLGNPGRQYLNNRHNIGFKVLDNLADHFNLRFSKMQQDALLVSVRYQDQRVLLAKPQTFMNRSGKVVASLARYYRIPREHLLIVYDDVDLPYETIRLKPEGGAGGQKGMLSIINQLGTDQFPRLRIGIGRPPGRMEVADYVLQDFSNQEAEVLDFVLDQAVDAVLLFLREGIDRAMTVHNQTPD